jgi:hypothetical protein
VSGLVIARFALPDGRLVRLEVECDLGSPGSLDEPPTEPGVYVVGGSLCGGRALSECEVEALNECDAAVYGRLCDAAWLVMGELDAGCDDGCGEL